ncbi:Phage shock protein PspC (stress-responsive transcriptional regulator) [Catalinimonas alkaloidigena]|uniref:Phage shock protein PspC (Stress-responsive transcriptional regulator) n=1 Tax=Catalinimonas alkaloidigena TaxID=1075417 RepID=A0A1G9H2B6_9BACT|nr:PspC domain-containing protein [Catalinimonas alkaloidigena]SDL07100.1 Phage shock protein PspC (stress-responsive transcriptional regulator) [Catalinimonas alkaloidigena]
MNAYNTRLFRSRDRMIGGVCGGLANYFGIDPTIFRILFVVVSVASAAFPGTIVYLLLWMVMPEEPYHAPYDSRYESRHDSYRRY